MTLGKDDDELGPIQTAGMVLMLIAWLAINLVVWLLPIAVAILVLRAIGCA